MKSKFLSAIFVVLVLSACEQKNIAIQNELRLIEKTAKDTTQPDYIRDSAATFEKILKGESGVSKSNWIQATGDMLEQRSQTTILTYTAFLKALEKTLPEKFPSPDEYDSMKEQTSKSKVIESNVARTILMIGESIKEIPLFGDPTADAEIVGVLKRFEEKHGASETGKKILEFLNMLHEQGVTARSWGIKPWETPRRPPEYVH